MACGGKRRVRRAPLDVSGRPIESDATVYWELVGPVGHLEHFPEQHSEQPAKRSIEQAATRETTVCGGDDPAEGWLRVTAELERQRAEAEAPVEVLEILGRSRSAKGIPPPVLVEDPGAPWRSRWVDNRWEVNAAHRDYRAVADRPALKLRYLAALFSKEIVLRSTGDPRLAAPLEQMVEVFAFADRRLGARGRQKPKR